MNEEFEIIQENNRAFSYFPEIFKNNLAAYLRREPGIQLGGNANNWKNISFFRDFVKKESAIRPDALEAVDIFIGIIHIFDQLTPVAEFLALEKDEKSEYVLSRRNSKFGKERITYILRESIAPLLTADHTDLRDEIKELLDLITPKCYIRLLAMFMPDKLGTNTRPQLMIDNFIKVMHFVYIQKLFALCANKTPYVGWDLNVKSFANREEKDAYAFLQNKLTLVRIEGPGEPQYYIYGNTDGSNWRYTQIPWEKVKNIDFNLQEILPTRSEYKALYDEIVAIGGHTLSNEEELHNFTMDTEYQDYYLRVIKPIEIYGNFLTSANLFAGRKNRKVELDSAEQVKDSEKLMASRTTQGNTDKFNFGSGLFKTLFAGINRQIAPEKRNFDPDAAVNDSNDSHADSENPPSIKR